MGPPPCPRRQPTPFSGTYMAHRFLQKMLRADTHTFQGRILICLLGVVLLGNAFAARILFPQEPISDLLAALSALLLGGPLLYQAAIDLWRGASEMNELAALGFLAAFSSTQYKTAAAIAFFMLLSQLLEYRSQLGARKAIEALLRLAPRTACRFTPDGREEIVADTQLQPGDRVRVRPGDRIPADGTVTTGSSAVNEASITGESMPVDKQPSDSVFGGALNLAGVLELEVAKAGADSTLAKIQHLILDAESSQTPTMQLIQRYLHYYTPFILALAAITLFFTGELNRAISILVIACPCTILLSVPSAKVAALGAAAGLGVIIKNVSILERAGHVNTVVFDKTGTLTTGAFVPVEIVTAPGAAPEEVLRLAAGAEHASRHPIAQAVVQEARARNIPLPAATDFEETSGRGVRARILDDTIFCGRADWLQDNGCPVPEAQSNTGTSVLHVGRNGTWIGAIYLADALRHDAPATLANLRTRGIQRLVILTGDRQAVAQQVADTLQCDVHAEVLPADKMDHVQELRRQGHVVAVVGDGVNDAPALAAGDVSIAMGAAGSDVAIHSASIVLLNNKLNRIPFVIGLARRAVAVIHQNLLFALSSIAALILLSAAGVIPPLLAVLFHTGSALAVVLNASRLFREGEALP